MNTESQYDPHGPVPCDICVFRNKCVNEKHCSKFAKWASKGDGRNGEYKRKKYFTDEDRRRAADDYNRKRREETARRKLTLKQVVDRFAN